MNDLSLPGYARVEQPFGADIPFVHCPICGTPSHVGSYEEGISLNPCPHLEFIYGPEDFEYQTEDCEKRFADVEWDEDDEFSDVVVKAGYDNKLLAIDITFGGMASGPVWVSVVWGYNFEKVLIDYN